MAHVGDKNVQFGVADVRTFVVSGSEESVREDIDRDSDRDSSGSDELLITTAQKSIRKRSDFHKMAHDDTYKKLVADGKRHMHSAAVSFPDGWDVQLIVDCGYNFAGHRIILFASQFLSPYVDDDDEMNRIVQYCLMRMDEIATRENYIFVLCGCEWSKPSVAQKNPFRHRHFASELFEASPTVHSSPLDQGQAFAALDIETTDQQPLLGQDRAHGDDRAIVFRVVS